MLSWSAETIGTSVDVHRLVGDGDIGIPADRQLVNIGRASVGTVSDSEPVAALAVVVGEEAAVYAAAVAAAFELLNRAVDAVGLPVGRASRSSQHHIIEALEMDDFPHADM